MMSERPKRILATVGFVLGMGLFAWQGIARVPAELERLRSQACLALEPEGSWKSRPALPFSLPDYAGREVSLDAYRGRVVFLDFWATWCPPCVDEMPSLERLASRFAGRSDFALLAVSEDKDWSAIREFFAKGSKLTVLLDQDWKVAHDWGTEKLPETYLLDRSGTIRAYFVNKRDWSTPEAARCIESLLQEKR